MNNLQVCMSKEDLHFPHTQVGALVDGSEQVLSKCYLTGLTYSPPDTHQSHVLWAIGI